MSRKLFGYCDKYIYYVYICRLQGAYRSHEVLLFVSNMMTDNGALLMISVAVVCEWMVIDQNNEYNRVLLYHSII